MSSMENSSGQAKGHGKSLLRTDSTAGPSANSAVNAGRWIGRGDSFVRFSKRYLMALQNYLLHSEEVFLQLAYELGRQAVAEGIGLLNLLRIHTAAARRCTETDPAKIAAAEAFFM